MNTIIRRSLLTLVSSAFALAPNSVIAGGGGAATKTNTNVRIKNMSAADANTPLLAIESVEVGDAGNDPAFINSESAGYVGSSFRMSKYEISIAEYVTFLNTVARRGDGANATVVASLYDSRMATDANVAGIARSGTGMESSPYVYSAIGDPKKPIAYVDWFSAARFANWMHNGATATADIENGAYNLAGGFDPTASRQPGAKWWIPSHDEWFKAAYYKGGSTAAGYWMFPTRSDTLPENTPSTGSNHANFIHLGLFAVTQSATLDSSLNYLTAVGTFANSPSAYGTFDQGGNLEEWTDDVVYTTFGASRRTRGGAWNSGGLNDDVNPIPTALPSDRSNKIGFRLARSTSASSVSTSRTFTVKLGTTVQFGIERNILPGQIVQFRVNKGNFTVIATDAEVATATTTATFNTGSKKTIFIEVNGDGSQVTLVQSASTF